MQFVKCVFGFISLKIDQVHNWIGDDIVKITSSTLSWFWWKLHFFNFI